MTFVVVCLGNTQVTPGKQRGGVIYSVKLGELLFANSKLPDMGEPCVDLVAG